MTLQCTRHDNTIFFLFKWLTCNLLNRSWIDFVRKTTENPVIQCGAALTRLMANIGGPREAKRRLVASVVNSKLLYAALIWTSALNNHAILKKLLSAQRGVMVRISRLHTLFLCQVGRGKRGCRSGSGRTTHPWHDGLSHAPVCTKMDTYRVIRHRGDEDKGARWACRAWQQRGPVEIASGPAPAVLRLEPTWLSASFRGEIASFLPWLARLVGLPNGNA